MENSLGMNIIPDNDQERIDALRRYKIVDTPPEDAFDHVARLATQIFKVPIALVSLIDAEKVYFKANVGMGNARVTSRGISLCSLAILKPEVTVFEDASKEQCLLSNPNVIGDFGLKFYAGAPLTTSDGFRIGTLCIIDKQTRLFTTEEAIILEGLAKIVMDEIELRLSSLSEIDRQAQISEEYQSVNEELMTTNEELSDAQKNLSEALLASVENEVALDDLVQRFNIALDAGQLGSTEVDLATGTMRCTALFKKCYGREPHEEFTYPDLFNTMLPHYRDEIKRKVGVAKETNTIYEAEYEVVWPDGSIHWISAHGRPRYDESGVPNRMVGMVSDITEKVKARQLLEETLEEQQALNEELTATNEELAEVNNQLYQANETIDKTRLDLEATLNRLSSSNKRFRFLVNEAPVAIATLQSRSLVIETANKMILQIWGKEESVIGQTLEAGLPELEGQPFLQILDDVYTSGTPFFGNEALVKLEHNGHLEDRYVDFIYQPLMDEERKTSTIMVVAIDVTEQVLSKRKLQKAEEMLRFSIEAANVGTWFIDAASREFIPSPRLKELFGYLPDEVMPYESALDQIAPEYRDKVVQAVESSITKGESYHIEYPIIGFHDHQLRWVRALGRLDKDEYGQVAHFSGVMMDITEQKQDDLRKNDFIGMVSHELKTPLTSLSAYTQMLHGKAVKQQDTFTAGALEKMITQVRKMNVMINGFLNVSRLESGKIHIDSQPFDLSKVIEQAVEEHSLIATGHTIIYLPEGEIIVNADADKISSVISNLLSNAIKYSPSGKTVKVTSRIVGEFVEVSVRDQGMGIKPKDLEKLFDRYYRVDNQDTQHISGFGIGLYLSFEIIQRHHGRIWAESKLDEGSTFYFSLPILKGK